MSKGNTLEHILEITPSHTEVDAVDAGAAIQDNLKKCFTPNPPEDWNFTIYLFPLWCMGVILRYGILFPLRVIILTIGWMIFLSCYIPVHVLLKGHDELRNKLERSLVKMICSFFVASWNGIVKYHGTIPSNKPNQLFVSNHTSMIDFMILEQKTTFSVVMQKHPGWVGFLQNTILSSIGCIWFNRANPEDRKMVARRLKEHVEGANNNPLLIFPEGTCVNNEYTVMFKKSAFDLGCTICPIAIKYNKIFVDAYWNSREESFSSHLFRLMTSWALVCDVWFLEPQTLNPEETAIEFSDRVREMICEKAGLKKLNLDGYLKHALPKP